MANQNTYGLMDLIDNRLLDPNDRVADVNADDLAQAVLIDNAQHNADIAAFQRLFCETTEEYFESVEQSASARNQPLDEKGRSIPMKPVPPYNVYYPLLASGNAWGDTWAARQLLTVRKLANIMNTLYRGDYNWVIDHILAALFVADGYSHRDPVRNTAVTVEGLANGDSVQYYSTFTGESATDNHLLATASAIADNANPYPAIYTEITEHPGNEGDVISFIPTSLKATTTALGEFHSDMVDSDITLGADTDRLTGSLGVSLPPFTTLLGKTESGVWIVEMPKLPSGFIVTVTSLGPRPLARRIQREFGDGFLVRGEREDWPLHETQLSRWEGYGGRNRVGAVIQRIGNGSYAVPTNYESPMA